MTATDDRARETDTAERMSDHEALMWNIEKDPWLNPNGAALFVFDRPIDVKRLRARMRHSVSRLPRFYQRVQPGLGRLSTPAWVPDPEFDFDAHFRVVRLPEPGTHRQLLDMAATLYSEPLDRTRPLWRMVVIEGLESGEGALWSLMHHAISDGIGQLRIGEMFQDLERKVPRTPEIDLEGFVAAEVAAHGTKEAGGDLGSSFASTAAHTVSHLARRSIGTIRRAAGEVAMWPADPTRIGDTVGDAAALIRTAADQLNNGSGEGLVGAPLFHSRSRHRHLEMVRVRLDELKAASAAAGASVNDAFVAVMADAVSRYHEERNASFDTINVSFVVSTRTDSVAGGNAFTPVVVQVPAAPMPIGERLVATHDVAAEARDHASRGGGLATLSGALNLLPTSVVARTVRSQAAKIDLATSNLRGAPFRLYIAGAKVRYSVTMGPLAGTPCNATALSYRNSFDIGLFIDPVAIEDPAAFRECVEASFAALLG